MKTLLLLTIIAMLSGCASYGNKLNTNYIKNIKKGETTEQEILTNLGSPMTVSLTPEGLKMMMYMHIYSSAKASAFIPIVGAFAGGADTDTQTLQIWIDENGIVKNYAFSNSQTELNTGVLAN